MKKKLINFTIFLLIINLIFNCTNNYVLAESQIDINTSTQVENLASNSLEIYAESCCLLDVDSNIFLYEKNQEKIMFPASTTKLMTAIIVLENCSDLAQMVNISYYSVKSVPYTYSVASVQPGENFSIIDLLKALLIASANDVAYSLAEFVVNNGNNYSTDSSSESKEKFDESISKFSNLMNEKAKELGCKNTNFVNPNGIHNENHVSTAYDLALIGQYAYKNETIRTLAKTLNFSLDNSNIYTGELRKFYSTNLLLYKEKSGYYEYANGLKTGYTDAAQSCIIASARKGDRNLIAVILNSNHESDANSSREADCKRLFEYGFNNYSSVLLVNPNDVIRSFTVINGTNESRKLNVLCQSELKALVATGEAIDVTPQVTISKHLAPISKGEIIGTITYTINEISYSSNLVAEHDVYSINYEFVIFQLLGLFAFLLFTFTFLNIKISKK